MSGLHPKGVQGGQYKSQGRVANRFGLNIVSVEQVNFSCLSPTFYPVQKQHQLSEEAHLVLFDSCCLWKWLREKMETSFPGPVLEQHDSLFEQGFQGCNYLNHHLGIYGPTYFLWLNTFYFPDRALQPCFYNNNPLPGYDRDPLQQITG